MRFKMLAVDSTHRFGGRGISLKEMRVLFPDCQIYKERVGILFVKSYIAYRG